ncbi:uncharacterized protein A1O5_03141 [Cladophialophora psammophila CBS 110553]|uniref:BTB domain-containing protein n=1 Tax=Cladophialophora psammophila CBS 110553 TaxID=1182543 RepID=W9X901_9EURO|nr:uncharacterized protein A1O5_03141 [Cladophialophora psammophila CBS 110553]EXJ73381.1 hypothetical protein A1O5_03141 [Cladophialophora psammophila CBS 110553]
MSLKRLSSEDHYDARSKKTSFTVSDDIITVTVGKEQLRHLIHESVLWKCPFFDKCLHSGMREQEEKAIILPEDDPEDFAIIVKWLYAEKIPDDINWHRIIPAYNAASKFCMPELQNALVDALRSQMEDWCLTPEWVSHIWARTEEGSQLRELVLDAFCYDISKKPSRYNEHNMEHKADADGPKYAAQMGKCMENEELALALLWRFADPAFRPKAKPCKMKGCVYHVHEDEKKCSRP